MTDYAKKAARGTGIIFASNVLGFLLAYLARAVLARNLSPSDFGLFYAAFTILMFLALVTDFGMTQALAKYIPEFGSQTKQGHIKDAIITTLLVKVGFGLLGSVVLFLSAGYLAVSYFHAAAALPVLKIMALILLVNSLVQVILGLSQGMQDMAYNGLVYFSTKFLFFVSIIVLMFSGFGMDALLPTYAHLAAIVLSVLLFIPYLFKTFLKIKSRMGFSRTVVVKLFNFALPSTLTAIGWMVIGYIDTIVLTYFVGLDQVGVYNTVLPTVLVLSYVGASIAKVMLPMASEIWTKGLGEKLGMVFGLLQRYALLIVLPFCLIMLTYPALILTILFTSKYASGALAMQVLAIGVIFLTLSLVNQSIIAGAGRPGIVTKIMLFAAIFNAITNYFLIPIYGIVGAAATTTASYLIMLLLSSFYAHKFVEIKVPLLSWAKTALAGIVFVLAVHFLKQALVFHWLLEAFVCIGTAFVLYLGVCFLLKITSMDEVRKIIQALRR